LTESNFEQTNSEEEFLVVVLKNIGYYLLDEPSI